MPAKPLTIPDIARRCNVGQNAVRNWIQRGVTTVGGVVFLKGWKAGRLWRVQPADLDAFLAACSPEGYRAQAEAERAQDERVEEAVRFADATWRRR